MSFIEHYLAEIRMTLKELPRDQIEKIKDILLSAIRGGRRIFIMGNGGSAATASHFACDLASRSGTVKVMALTNDIPFITARANDTGYANVFAGPLENLLETGDVVIGISVSGDSENVLRAVSYANRNGAVTVGLTGSEGGRLKDAVRECLLVPSASVERVEDVHLILAHLLSSYLGEALR